MSNWNHSSTYPALGALGLLSFTTIAITAADIAIERKILGSIESTFTFTDTGRTVQVHPSTDPSQYPYAFAGLIFSLITFLTASGTAIALCMRNAQPLAVAYSCTLWCLAWLGLFGYGIWLWDEGIPACSDRGLGCAQERLYFAYFIFCPLDALACVATIVVARRANKRKHARSTTTFPMK